MKEKILWFPLTNKDVESLHEKDWLVFGKFDLSSTECFVVVVWNAEFGDTIKKEVFDEAREELETEAPIIAAPLMKKNLEEIEAGRGALFQLHDDHSVRINVVAFETLEKYLGERDKRLPFFKMWRTSNAVNRR